MASQSTLRTLLPLEPTQGKRIKILTLLTSVIKFFMTQWMMIAIGYIQAFELISTNIDHIDYVNVVYYDLWHKLKKTTTSVDLPAPGLENLSTFLSICQFPHLFASFLPPVSLAELLFLPDQHVDP